MTAGEIRALAVRAGIGPGVTVLDLCCGIAGPGRLLMRELGCDYLGVDASASAVALARERAGDLPCRFAVARVPPLPAGPFDVVLLLETMLAFEDKDALVREIAAALRPGGRFAFTLEEGAPLTAAERAAMPNSDTVWLTPLDEMTASLERAGLAVTWLEDHSRAHRATAQALAARTPDAGSPRRRPPGGGRPGRRPPPVGRVAGRGTRPEARAGGRAGLEVEPVEVHDLDPRRGEVVHELLARVVARVDLRERAQLGVRAEDEVDAASGPLELARGGVAALVLGRRASPSTPCPGRAGSRRSRWSATPAVEVRTPSEEPL